MTADDYNFDGRQEVQLDQRQACGPDRAGPRRQLYELDVRSICHNLLATLTRRPEAYHRKVLAGTDGRNDVASVSDRVVFKQEGLDERLQYDEQPRKSLIDHFYDPGTTLESRRRAAMPTRRGDFPCALTRPGCAAIRTACRCNCPAQGIVEGVSLRITKSMTLEAGSSTLEIAYLLEGLPQDRSLHFAVEFNFAGMPAGADDRYFYGHEAHRLGQLGTQLDLHDAGELGLVDEWLGLDVNLVVLATRSRVDVPDRERSANRKAASNWSINRSPCCPIGTSRATQPAAGRWPCDWRSTPAWPKAAARST